MIEPSNSPFRNRILIGRKSDGTIRFLFDGRDLNDIQLETSFSLPMVTDQLENLIGKKIFTTIDLKSGFFQITLGESSRPATAFQIEGIGTGPFQFCVTPQGSKTSSAAFLYAMSLLFGDMFYDQMNAWVDDILLHSKDHEDHQKSLKKTLHKMLTANVKISATKCAFAQEEANYLGYIINKDGIKADPGKVAKILTIGIPTCYKSIMSFLGSTVYFRRVIENLSIITAPLRMLAQMCRMDRHAYKWTPECQTSFDKIKDLLSKEPIVAHPDWTKPFAILTDACKDGLAYILIQEDDKGRERVIEYSGRATTKGEKNYPATVLELLAVVCGLKHYKRFCIQNRVKIKLC